MLTLIEEHRPSFHDTLTLFVTSQVQAENLKIVCISEGRNETSYEIFDEAGQSLSKHSFDSWLFPIIGRFTKRLTDDLNVLFDDKLTYQEVGPIAEKAVSKCESRYGNTIDGGDCVIHITYDSLEV